MATKFKEGDRVQVVDREATADDAKSSLFFNYYRGLTGAIQKVYETTREATIEVELDCLPEAVASRHHEIQEAMKSKWLDGLSEEARNRLSDAERDFQLRYTILVSLDDLTNPGKRAVSAAKPGAPTGVAEKAPGSVAAAKPTVAAEGETPRRRTAAEIEADEEAYLRSRKG